MAGSTLCVDYFQVKIPLSQICLTERHSSFIVGKLHKGNVGKTKPKNCIADPCRTFLEQILAEWVLSSIYVLAIVIKVHLNGLPSPLELNYLVNKMRRARKWKDSGIKRVYIHTAITSKSLSALSSLYLS